MRNGDTGDVACDHYHRYREDVACSPTWALERLPLLGRPGRGCMPGRDRAASTRPGSTSTTGWSTSCSTAASRPYVTLYHWDLPQALEDAGGWPVRATAEAFADYADVVAAPLGDRVAAIATLNEPWCVADIGYRHRRCTPPDGRTRPRRSQPPTTSCVGHGLAMQAIRAAAPGTPVGIVLNLGPVHPASAASARPRGRGLRARPATTAGSWTRSSGAPTPSCARCAAAGTRWTWSAAATWS